MLALELAYITLFTTTAMTKSVGVWDVPPRASFKLSDEGSPAVIEMYRIWYQNPALGVGTKKCDKTTECCRKTINSKMTSSVTPTKCRSAIPTRTLTYIPLRTFTSRSLSPIPENWSLNDSSENIDNMRKIRVGHGSKVQSTSISNYNRVGHKENENHWNTTKFQKLLGVKLCSCQCCSHKKPHKGTHR